MSILADIIQGGTSGILGSVLGVVGGFLTSIQNRKQQEIKNAHELAMMGEERQQLELEHKLSIQKTEVEVQGEIAKIDAQTTGDAYKEAIKQTFKQSLPSKVLEQLLNGNKFQLYIGTFISFMLGVVDVLKAIVRPGVTLYLIIVSTVLTYTLQETISLSSAFDVTEMTDIYRNIIFSVLFLTNMVVGWWFQNRQQIKFSNNLSDGNSPIEN